MFVTSRKKNNASVEVYVLENLSDGRWDLRILDLVDLSNFIDRFAFANILSSTGPEL